MTKTTAGLAAVWLLAASCAQDSSHAPVVNPTQTGPSASGSIDDQQVLECALADLVRYSGKDWPGAEPLSVAAEAVDWSVTVDEVLYRHDEESWRDLSSAEETALAQAAADLVSRTTLEKGGVRFQSQHSRLNVGDTATSPEPRYGESRPIHLWPPGFTADRRLVVVRMSIPTGWHHANATYVLARQGTGWTIRVRQFVHYF